MAATSRSHDLAHWLVVFAAGLPLLLLGTPSVAWPADLQVSIVTLTSQPVEASVCSFPDSIVVDIKSSPPFPGSLVLHRNDDINTEPPAFTISANEDGDLRLSEIRVAKTNMAAYKNSEEGAAFLVKCTSRGAEIEGTLYAAGRKYRVSRVEAHVLSVYQFILVPDTPINDQILTGYAESIARGDLREGSLPQKKVTESSARAKRTTKKDYYIDVLIILDYAVYNYWLKRNSNDDNLARQKAKEYYVYIFNGVNSRFDTVITQNFQLHIVISGFIFATKANAAPWTEGAKEPQADGRVAKVKAETSLTLLEMYVKRDYGTLPAHDHVMLFTDLDLYSVNDNGFRFDNTAGFAFVDTMCSKTGTSISVVEDHGGFQSEGTVTHELGHSMGSVHDGENNACNSLDRFVMATGVNPQTDANARNPWKFSSCSTDSFALRVQTLIKDNLEDDCLLTQHTNSELPSVSVLPGQVDGPDEQCRQVYGAESYLCRGSNFGTVENVCLAMYCRNPAEGSGQCTENTAADGTCCGAQKWCLQGSCVPSNEATCYISETCPFGQRQGIVFNGKTCDKLEPSLCYETSIRLTCCDMCDKVRAANGAYGCEYGDTVTQCEASFCNVDSAVGRKYDSDCCGTCSHVVTTLTPLPAVVTTIAIKEVPPIVIACSDVAQVTFNGVASSCSAQVELRGMSFCCQATLLEACCSSCSKVNTGDPACPFGDCQNCAALVNSQVACDAAQRASCCKTCQDLDAKLTTPAPVASTRGPLVTAAPVAPTPAVPVSTCVPILGVVTCGAPAGLRVQGALLVLCLVLARRAV